MLTRWASVALDSGRAALMVVDVSVLLVLLFRYDSRP
eukprot:SAG11_NODE_2524_length_3260_cov_1.524518_6_plen_37_part_00